MRQFNNNYDRRKVREYIINVNNLLFELKDELSLDIPEINKISDHTFDDKAKKEIIASSRVRKSKKREKTRLGEWP